MTSSSEPSSVREGKWLAPWLLAAAWSALLFGLIEGAVLAASRLNPRILAPTKVSNEILWVAPLVHLGISLLAAVAGAVAYRFLPARLRRWPAMRVAVGVFVFTGASSAILSPRLANTVSSIVLALGLAVGATRLID